MKITVTEAMFRREFAHHDAYHVFSYDGLTILYNALMDHEEAMIDAHGMDHELELDPVAIRCEYTELYFMDVYTDYSDAIERHSGYIAATVDEQASNATYEAVKEFLQDKGALMGETPARGMVFRYAYL
jgi:hydrogenase maturation factor